MSLPNSADDQNTTIIQSLRDYNQSKILNYSLNMYLIVVTGLSFLLLLDDVSCKSASISLILDMYVINYV